MTVYVVDPTHPAPPRQGDSGLYLRSGDSLVLLEGGEIIGRGFGDAVYGEGNNLITVSGRLHSEQWGGIVTQGRVTITTAGQVTTGADWWYFGVVLKEGGPNYLNNAGSVSGGVFLYSGYNTVINSGLISGGIGCSLTTSGSASLSLENTGTITGGARYAVWGETGAPNTIINGGKIIGNVSLGQDSDFFDGRGGRLDGELALGAGEDIAFGGESADSFFLGMLIEGVESGTGQGTDFIDGGGGSDSLRFYDSVTIDLRNESKQLLKQGAWATLRGIENLVGGQFSDNFIGNNASNILTGNAGNDTLSGYGGDDLLIGGSGSDSISGGEGIDVSGYSGNFADYTIRKQADGSYSILDNRSGSNDGFDVLTGIEYLQFADRTIALRPPTNSAPTSVTISNTIVRNDVPVGTVVGQLNGVDPDGDVLGYFLASNPGGHFRIHGDKLLVDRAFSQREVSFDIVVRASDPHGASIERTFTIHSTSEIVTIQPVNLEPQLPLVAPTTVEMAAAPLTLKGGKKADVLVGGAGNDLLNGGLGNDRLSGGEGSDVFAFSTKLKKNVDRLIDFSGADDTIQLLKAVFGKLQKGVLDKEAFRIGVKAMDADDRIVYNAKTGALSYDADGSGTAHEAVTFAKVKAGTHLTADDFFVL